MTNKMCVASNHDFKNTIASVKLNKINPHDYYADYTALLAITNYMLPSNGILTEQALTLNMLMHPIVVIHAKKAQNRYLCIAGIRSLMLAQSSLGQDKTLSVTIIERLRLEEIESIVNADVLLSPLLMSIRCPSAIGTILMKMSKENIDSLLIKEKNDKSNLAKQMGYAKNTIFPPKSNKLAKAGDRS